MTKGYSFMNYHCVRRCLMRVRVQVILCGVLVMLMIRYIYTL